MRTTEGLVSAMSGGPAIGTLLTRTARRFRDKPAVRCEGRSITFTELDERSNRVASLLRSHGVGPGDRVAIVRDSSIEFVEDEFGVYKTGAAEVAVNSRLTLHEQLDLLRSAEPAVVLVDDRYSDRAAEFGALSSVRLCLSTTEERERQLNAASSESCPPDDASSADYIWQLHYSSGTTGKPKAAVLTQKNFLASVKSYLEAVGGIAHTDVFLDPAPLVTAGGWALWPHHLSGCTCVVLPRFTPDGFVEAVQEHRPTTALAVPTMIADLVATVDDPAVLASLHTVLYTASAISASVLDAALEIFGSVFIQAYAMSETMTALTVLSKLDHQDSDADVRKSAGFPQLDVEIRIVAEGEEVSGADVGRIAIRTPDAMREYWRDPELTAQTLRGGWLFSGDVGRLDERGCLYVLDRADDVIISAGFNVYPREVEDALARHPAVAEVAVVGRPDTRAGELVTAVIRPSDDTVTDTELLDFAKQFLATYKVPREIHRRPSPLPRNSAGKLLRRTLRESLAGGVPTASANTANQEETS